VKQYGLSENGRAASGSGSASGVGAARDREARERMTMVRRALKGLDIVAGFLKDLPFAFRGRGKRGKGK